MKKIAFAMLCLFLFTALCSCSVDAPVVSGPDDGVSAPSVSPAAEESSAAPALDTLTVNGVSCAVSAETDGDTVTVVISCPMDIGLDPGPELQGKTVLVTETGREFTPESKIHVMVNGSNFDVALTFQTGGATGLTLKYAGQTGPLPQ